MTIPYDGIFSSTVDSNASPKIIHKDPIIKYIAIIIMMLLVINIFAGWKCIQFSTKRDVIIQPVTNLRAASELLNDKYLIIYQLHNKDIEIRGKSKIAFGASRLLELRKHKD